MVHYRLNEKEANPNPHINFISALPHPDLVSSDEAHQLLRALAAQVRPIMKAHGFAVNSFEEYEYNPVFAGRNWNNGEVVELVLRRANGVFSPASWLLSTLCHELAHIKHMNHGPAFQALWRRLNNEVRGLQNKGYYGDGYWSSGHRLSDSAKVGGQGIEPGDLPEYMCGGAQSRTRPTSLRRRRHTQPKAGPSNHTGAQTVKKRKAGSRVTAQNVFKGDGAALNHDAQGEESKKAGTGFRKKAGSKRAREERAMAAEKRLKALQGHAVTSTTLKLEDESQTEDDDEVFEESHETDQDRRRTMLEAGDKTEFDDLKATAVRFTDDFILPPADSFSSHKPHKSATEQEEKDPLDIIDISSDSDVEDIPSCEVPQTRSTFASASTSKARPSASKGKSKSGTIADRDNHPKLKQQKITGVGSSQFSKSNDKGKGKAKGNDLKLGSVVEDEVQLRKKESIGLALTGGGYKLGSEPLKSTSKLLVEVAMSDQDHRSHDDSAPWSCLVCTLSNQPHHLACSACSTVRGESSWSGT
ncbi:hypothetical protein JAAARDRAFT_35796 [Jaapia argillacea MUCL 33604]|uniref:WLM domain-containing protein n=1 Tax=Jaapia argillacea MUCL 33604 TaxID=933084 RepID=A0A067Q118_9AGAM|nr:hypothetical protein JAAARDRAFT_35796 [Jaapia argillacea MUCL 33604]